MGKTKVRKKTRYIFNGRLIKLALRRTILPNGNKVSLEVISHPGAALIVPFLDSRRIIMIRQYRPVIGGYIYELPAGTVDGRETALNCARREIVEETGYKAKIMKRLGLIYPAPGYTDEKIVIFSAHGLSKTCRMPEADEVIRVAIFARPQVKKLFSSGKIVDAKTICALAFAGLI